jgi:predicted aspartyl protease
MILKKTFFCKFVGYEIFLGQFFFINDAWTFNYKTGKMSVNTPISKKLFDENIQVLGFKKDMLGNKRFGHQSMKLVIDGKIIDFLFDTGAAFLLSDSGKTKLGLDTKAPAGCKILISNIQLQQTI